MKRSEPTTQAQTKINIPKGLKTYLNDSEKYLTSFQGFKTHIAILHNHFKVYLARSPGPPLKKNILTKKIPYTYTKKTTFPTKKVFHSSNNQFSIQRKNLCFLEKIINFAPKGKISYNYQKFFKHKISCTCPRKKNSANK